MRQEDWELLAAAAWAAREKSRVLGKTLVGAAVMDEDGDVHIGCNVEHKFRSHDVHAEVNALSSMVAAGKRRVVAVLVAADREFFSPCGSCMDWIMELGGPETAVGVQNIPGGPVKTWTASELMPYYPF